MPILNHIRRGIIKRPVKVCLYAVEGIGKSTFASKFPNPLFFDLDRGTARLDVDRVEGVYSWVDLINDIKEFIETPDNPYDTIVIDTADAAARLCEKYVIATRANGKRSIEDIPYGKGYKMLAEEFAVFLTWCEAAINSGFNVVILAHAIMKTVTKPDDMGAYDHWELKLPGNTTNKIGPLVKEWADLLLFADYKTVLVTDEANNKKKARGGKRIMYASHTPFADAKNRFGLPDQLPFDYSEVAKIIPSGMHKGMPKDPTADAFIDVDAKIKADKEKQEKKKTTKKATKKRPTKKSESEALKELKKRMEADDIEDFRLMDAVAIAGAYPKGTKLEELPDEFINTQLLAKWDSFKRFITEKVPF